MATLKNKTLWFGEMEFRGYPLRGIFTSEQAAKSGLLKEYKRQPEREFKNPSWEDLENHLDIRVIELPINEVVWP